MTGLVGISDDELLAVYRGAALVAVPSVIEGFGFPLLEALAAGAPVLASDIQPLRFGGGSAARYVDGGEEAWAAALQASLGDDAWRSSSMQTGPAQALKFPWRTTAEATLAVYREAAA